MELDDILQRPASPQGYIRVVDMGMARRIPYDAPDEKGIMRTCTRAFSHVGTPLYMAPELYASTGYNKAVDIWALGVSVKKSQPCIVVTAPFPAHDTHFSANALLIL